MPVYFTSFFFSFCFSVQGNEWGGREARQCDSSTDNHSTWQVHSATRQLIPTRCTENSREDSLHLFSLLPTFLYDFLEVYSPSGLPKSTTKHIWLNKITTFSKERWNCSKWYPKELGVISSVRRKRRMSAVRNPMTSLRTSRILHAGRRRRKPALGTTGNRPFPAF